MSCSLVLEQLRELKLTGMFAAYKEIMERPGTPTVDQALLELIHAEVDQRRLRAIRYQLGQARFPGSKDLDSFDFETSPVDETHTRSLNDGSFLSGHINNVLVGGTGSGKSHLAIAIAARAAYEFWLDSQPLDCGMTIAAGLRG